MSAYQAKLKQKNTSQELLQQTTKTKRTYIAPLTHRVEPNPALHFAELELERSIQYATEDMLLIQQSGSVLMR